ncbi:uncharacterized protein TRAVEDRAFT_49149 [Trametes versicolor FP-101664 SS1]|uniref:uncharacterized protein n=1 Tax=Trametes versicolor (strain FP-101664) TaxID=717944 RepID=UPI0004621974|nr:uncharacterized protein TRAVEDRAFT_49149 [Trametes versicolor FP-101664 SS1]EIW56318.1 hypothetical protein TRAVEDRAFT_49149 [Trametes versicolor FP-101664 SS1]
MLVSAYWCSVRGFIWCHGGYRLPLILWERVIDELSLPMGEEFWHPQALRACAAVCRGWCPRARCKLWHTTMIRTGSQASKLLDLIDDDPQLGQLILELQIYPARPGKELGCVSFHLPKLTSALPNLRLLCMKRVNWVCNPRAHSGPLAQFRSLVVLHLCLQHLVIHGKMFIEKPLSDEDALRLSVLRNPNACDKLAKIEVGSVLCEQGNKPMVLFPPPRVFGDSVASLSLQPHGSRLSVVLENVARYTHWCKHLRSLELSVDFSTLSHSSPPPTSCNLSPSPSLVDLPAAVRDFLDVLVGDEDEFGLLREHLPSLLRLHFQLQDGGSDYLKWWTKGITGRLPSIGHLVHVEIERVMEGGWSEAPRSSPGLSRLVMNVRTPAPPSS